MKIKHNLNISPYFNLIEPTINLERQYDLIFFLTKIVIPNFSAKLLKKILFKQNAIKGLDVLRIFFPKNAPKKHYLRIASIFRLFRNNPLKNLNNFLI